MTLPAGVGWFDLLTGTADELVAMGVERDKVVALRRAYTGAKKPWSLRWARTIGSWGRVRTAEALADELRVDLRTLRTKAKSLGTKYAIVGASRTQAELAVLSYTARDIEPSAVCRELGILEVERLLYCDALQEFLDEYDVDIDCLLDLDWQEYTRLWDESGRRVGPPEWNHTSSSSFPFSDEELASIVAAAIAEEECIPT